MATTNEILAAVFQEMAQLLQVLDEDAFRIAAFQRAGRALEDLPQDVAKIASDPVQLAKIPGIGSGMAKRIAEYVSTGNIAEHQALLQQVPPGVRDMLRIQGLGPKTAALLWRQAGIASLPELKTALEATPEKLLALPGMGAKKLANLQQNLAFQADSSRRFRIGQVRPLALWLASRLLSIPGVKQVQYAGSLRRGRETVGDLDILIGAESSAATTIAQALRAMPIADQVLASGESKTSIRTKEGLQIDFRIIPPEAFGAALLYFTGSKEHNVQLRQLALDQNLKLNEYGLFQGPQRLAAATEQEVYAALGLPYIPPELREARDEIARAQAAQLPTLLEPGDIQADLHAHTTASDGRWSIRELIQTALDHGYHTIAITDHSVSQTVAHGLSAQRLEQHLLDIRALAAEFHDRIAVLAGSEVDILPDGRLDYPDSLLQELDIVVASPHASLAQDSKKATARIRRAIDHPLVHIIGHPTGRLIGRRPGLDLDWAQILPHAATRGIALEINANSHRLDLRDAHAHAALEAGVKLSINTDAHSLADMDQMILGVITARRAGAGRDQVINTFSREQLKLWLAQVRRR